MSTRISALTETATLNDADLLAVVDVSDTAQAASGSTRKALLSTLRSFLALDEDDMASNSASHFPTQQSVKAYVDTSTYSLVSDTAPELGGDLDAADFDITGATEIRGLQFFAEVLPITLSGTGPATGTLDVSASACVTIGLTEDTTITVSGEAADVYSRVLVVVEQDGTGGHDITWSGVTSWTSGGSPTLESSPGGQTILVLEAVGANVIGRAFEIDIPSASDSAEGLVELATTAETDAGTDTGRAVTPDGLAGSYAGTERVCWVPHISDDDVSVADGKIGYVVPPSLDGMNIVSVTAAVGTAGTTGTTDVQVRRVRSGAAVDVLSTKATIDSGETTTETAATAPVINTSNDDLATGDVLYVDVDAVSTTAPQGLYVTVEARLP